MRKTDSLEAVQLFINSSNRQHQKTIETFSKISQPRRSDCQCRGWSLFCLLRTKVDLLLITNSSDKNLCWGECIGPLQGSSPGVHSLPLLSFIIYHVCYIMLIPFLYILQELLRFQNDAQKTINRVVTKISSQHNRLTGTPSVTIIPFQRQLLLQGVLFKNVLSFQV